MRRNLTYCTVLLLVVLLCSCRKRLEELYYNPDQTTEPAIEKFFTEMLDNNRVRPAYWEIRTFVAMHTGIYSQTLGFLNNNSAYQQNPGYSQDRWNDFYVPGANGGGDMAHFRSIEAALKNLPEEKKQEDQVFLEAARVVLYDHASQMIDLWGDIPFMEAGRLNTEGQIIFPAFDDAKEIYYFIIESLKPSAQFFRNASLSAASAARFAKHDILLSGNIDKWHRYVNALRLRLLMRISFFDEAFAKTEILAILSDPATYPLVDGAMGYAPLQTDVLLQPLTSQTESLSAALFEATNFSAPEYMLDSAMKPASDPRIPVMFDKYGRSSGQQFIPNTSYNGLPVQMSAEDQLINIGNYAILDSATFIFNNKLPGIVMSAAEVNFMKAEAFERWGGGDAQSAYETGIRQSIYFYYYLNSLNTVTKQPLTPPSAEEIENFLQHPFIQYTGSPEQKLQNIWLQKWLHFGFLQSVQSWSELRRTDTPLLTFRPATQPGYEMPPLRLVYPASETAYNPNYNAVKEKDSRNIRIFWDMK